MIQSPSPRLTLRQRLYRLRTSPRFPYLLLLGLLAVGGLSQAYYFWWDVRIERMLARNNGSVERIDVYPQWMKKYLGQRFVSRFEPIQRVSLQLEHVNLQHDHPASVDHRPGDIGLLRGAFFLRELRLYGKLNDDDVRHLKRLTQLRTVHCWYHPESVLEGVAELPKLTLLCLSFEDVPEPAVFQRLADMPQLERLSIGLGDRSRGPKTVEGMRELAKSPSLCRLDTQLSNDEFVALTSLLPDGSPPLPSLAELRIAGSHGVARQSLNNLKNLPSLVHLELSYWSITDAHLIPLKQLPHLRTLYVDTNQGITDEGVEVLVSMRNLQSLNVKETSISQQGLLRLATLPRLRCLRAHPIPETRAELRKRLPAGCELDIN